MRHICQTFFFFKGNRVILFNDNYFQEVKVHMILVLFSKANLSCQFYFRNAIQCANHTCLL